VTLAKNLAFIGFGFYVGIGPGIQTSGRTEVSGLGYVRYENSPPKQSNSVYQLFQASTQINSGSVAAFILITSSP